jgi:hypothetical protein
MSSRRLALLFLASLVVAWVPSAEGAGADAIGGSVSPADASDLQRVIDQAPPHGVVTLDRSSQIEIEATVRITKPLTLVGLNARLKPGLERTPLLEVLAEGVRIRDFLVEGNRDTVGQSRRAPLIVVRRGRFIIENGETNNSTKDGVMISPIAEYGDIEHGVVRNLTARGTIRDVVSMSGAGDRGLFIRHLVVENIRAYGSALRGPVEVSDGSEYVTVRDIYAESCAYGVDVQDHNRPGQVNRHITIEGVFVKDTPVAVRTANSDFGHRGLTIRNVSGEDWPAEDEQLGDPGELNRATSTPHTPVGTTPIGRGAAGNSLVKGWRPVHIRNTADVVIENVRIDGCPSEPCVLIENSDNVTVRNVTFTNGDHDGASMLVQDANDTLIDDVVFRGTRQPEFGIRYLVVSNERFRALRIRNVSAEDVRTAGIVLENVSESGSLASYIVTDNVAAIQIEVDAEHGLLHNNLAPR